MRKFISTSDIKLKKEIVVDLKNHCREYELDASDMFVYLNDEDSHVYIGFSNDDTEHIMVEDKLWYPRAEC